MARKCSHAALRSENIAPPFEQPRDATSYYCEGQSEYLILHGLNAVPTPRGHRVQIGEGALPVRHSLMHPIGFSSSGATSDPRAPRGRATSEGRIFVPDYNAC